MLTHDQIEKRKNRITSTRAPAILGVDQWKGPHGAAREALGIDLQLDEDNLPIAMLKGIFFEHSNCKLAEYTLRNGNEYLPEIPNIKLRKPPFKVHGVHNFIGSSCDRIAHIDGNKIACVEAKSYRRSNFDYGDFGGDKIDPRTLIQCVIHMACWELPVCYVPIDMAFEWGIFVIKRDRELEDLVLEKCAVFYNKFIGPNIGREPLDMVLPPVDGTDSTTDWLAAQYLEHNDTSEQPNGEILRLVDEYQDARDRIKEIDVIRKEAGNQLRDLVGKQGGDGFKGEVDDLFVTATWKNTKDRVKTDWMQVASDAGASDSVIERNTSVVPGGRRLYTKVKGKTK